VVAHRLTLVTGAATLVLILFGGLVTNTGSALAVPDWPTTFGHNMFLYPWSQMVGGVFYEHSHRLLGSLVGLLTLALAAVLWRPGGLLRALGLVAVAAVVVQGVLGGLRVVLLADLLAIVHACLAQAFFALICVIALLTSPAARGRAAPVEPATLRLAVVTAALVYLQAAFGALLTHAGWLELHLTGALAVYVVAPVATAPLRRSGDPVAAPMSRALLALLGVQLLLGAGSLVVRHAPAALPAADFSALALPGAHRVAGSLIVGVAAVLAVRVAGVARGVRGVAAAPSLTAVSGAR